MKFIDITEDYTVNLDAIFSLERREINSLEVQEEYENAVDSFSDFISENPPQLECNGQLYVPTPETQNDELFEIYREKFTEYLENEIQNYANTIKYEYFVILSTGVKVQISYSKYKVILDTIRDNG